MAAMDTVKHSAFVSWKKTMKRRPARRGRRGGWGVVQSSALQEAAGARTLCVPLGREASAREQRVHVAVPVRLRVERVGVAVEKRHVRIVVCQGGDLGSGRRAGEVVRKPPSTSYTDAACAHLLLLHDHDLPGRCAEVGIVAQKCFRCCT